MNSTTATNTNTTPNTEVMPSIMPSTDRERFEQTADQLQGFAELAATWRNVQRIAGMWTPARDADGLGEYVQELDKQFAGAFIKAFPSVEFMQDVLGQGGLDAIAEARSDSEQTANAITEAMSEAVEAPYERHQAPANWRTNPAMLTWQDVGSMYANEREQALKAMGYGDAGEDTEEAIYESVNQWLTRLTTMSGNPSRAGSYLLGMMRLIFVQEMERSEQAAAKTAVSKSKAKAK